LLRRSAFAVAWLALAVVIALGAAGIVTALDHLPGSSGRPELTWTADRAIEPELDAASADLVALADAVGVLGEEGRGALAALVARDAAAPPWPRRSTLGRRSSTSSRRRRAASGRAWR